jgi:hypothetical protein
MKVSHLGVDTLHSVKRGIIIIRSRQARFVGMLLQLFHK